MILKRFGHIALSLISCLMWVACDGDDNDQSVVPHPAYPEKTVNLSFSVGVIDEVTDNESRSSRAGTSDTTYFETEVSKYERIHQIRVIILRSERYVDEKGEVKDSEEQIVEHNRLVTLTDEGYTRYDDLNFEVAGNEVKSIYVIVNEDGVNALRPADEQVDFENIAVVGEPYTPDAIESIEIPAGTNGYLFDNIGSAPQYIPMATVRHGIQIDEPTHENYEQKIDPFYLSRAATKFSFTIKCLGADNSFFLKGITVNSIADSEYLLPNTAVYDPETGLLANGENVPSSNPAPDVAGHFTTTYNVPEKVEYKSYTFDFGTDLPIKQTETLISPQIYFCESKLGYDYNADLTNVLDPKKRPYTVSITIAHTETDADGQEKLVESTLGPAYLPNLPTLPRNTHVKVDMTLTETSLAATVELVPYISVTLDPLFGYIQPYPPFSIDQD